jgi:hypothetical protein
VVFELALGVGEGGDIFGDGEGGHVFVGVSVGGFWPKLRFFFVVVLVVVLVVEGGCCCFAQGVLR